MTKLEERATLMGWAILNIVAEAPADPDWPRVAKYIERQLADLIRGLDQFIPPADLGGDVPYGEVLEHYGLKDE